MVYLLPSCLLGQVFICSTRSRLQMSLFRFFTMSIRIFLSMPLYASRIGSKFIDELQLGAPSWTGQTHWKYQNIVLMHKSTVLHQSKFREGIVRQTKAERIQNPFVLQHQEAVKPFKHPTGLDDIWIYIYIYIYIYICGQFWHKAAGPAQICSLFPGSLRARGSYSRSWARAPGTGCLGSVFIRWLGAPRGLRHYALPGCGRRSGRAVHWATHHPPRAAPRPSLQAVLDSLSASMTPLGSARKIWILVHWISPDEVFCDGVPGVKKGKPSRKPSRGTNLV